MAARSKVWVYGRSLAGIAGSNPTGGHGCLSLVGVVCCQAEVSATCWSLVQSVVCLKVCYHETSENEEAQAP